MFSPEEEKETLQAQVEMRLTQEFEKRLECELENSQKQWSGSTDVSTLCILEVRQQKAAAATWPADVAVEFGAEIFFFGKREANIGMNVVLWPAVSVKNAARARGLSPPF